MFKQSSTTSRLRSALLAAGAAVVFTALPAMAQKQLPMEPIHETGAPVVPSYEGWWTDKDGNYNFMFGYFNRNSKEEVEIPIGPNNHIDPAGDYGQPTHFYPRRHWGVYILTLPKDVALAAKRPAWTLNVNGLSSTIPINPDPVYNINPFSEIGIGNTPPTISLDEKGPSVQGPKPVIVPFTAKVGQPLSFTVWAADDDKSLRPQGAPGGGRGRGGAGRGGAAAGGDSAAAPAAGGAAPGAAPADADAQLAAAAAAAGVDVDTIRQFLSRTAVGITFEKLRGPGDVKFAASKPKVEKIENGTLPKPDKFNGKATNTATFSAPGEYILRIYATDSSGEGGGGFLCCWTNIYAKVNVTN
ncbi:MAG TPA: hypothetical protein VEF06_09660 [Bryobacteraceae bacterium]|nr:hypothetical protein [Bryobacteraceae bacterium]